MPVFKSCTLHTGLVWVMSSHITECSCSPKPFCSALNEIGWMNVSLVSLVLGHRSRAALLWQVVCAKHQCCTALSWQPQTPRGPTWWLRAPTGRPRYSPTFWGAPGPLVSLSFTLIKWLFPNHVSIMQFFHFNSIPVTSGNFIKYRPVRLREMGVNTFIFHGLGLC